MALSDEHKHSLEVGRRESRAVRAYLERVDQNVGRRRRRPVEKIHADLAAVEVDLADAASIQRLHLLQRRIDLNDELEGSIDDDSDEVEANFVGVVGSYSARKAISWRAWREIGVEAAVLRRGGLRP